MSALDDAPKGNPGFTYGTRLSAHEGPWILGWMSSVGVWCPIRWVCDRHETGDHGEWVQPALGYPGTYIRLIEEPTAWTGMPKSP